MDDEQVRWAYERLIATNQTPNPDRVARMLGEPVEDVTAVIDRLRADGQLHHSG